MRLKYFFPVFAIAALFSFKALADCPSEILEKIDAIGDVETQEHYCTSVRVSGLNQNEKLVLLVPKNPDDKALFYIISSVGIRTIATLPFQSYKQEDYVKILVREIFGSQSDFQTECNAPQNAVQLAIDTKMGQSSWVFNVLQPVQCRVRSAVSEASNDKSTTVQIWNIDFYGGQAKHNYNGKWNIGNLKYRREMRQSFTKFVGGKQDPLYISQVARPFFPKCKSKNRLQTNIEPSAIFNFNDFRGVQRDNRKALSLNAKGIFPYYALKTAEQNRPHSIVLERKIGPNKAEPVGAWSISNLSELKNLILENTPEMEVRVSIKDLDCGEDIVSNWTFVGP